eukprot:CAMPEP_0180643640 /NCGR_PEP_ID=MMETSP1037_2-20121125/47935_1 /TAXON_ID=632150 /ORGANISM="Azadinium spinosum, Strain 3D9" /LENGTH=45 /DNA_ID= /DNA_START= /DNA_END= /DNA_ORIENTATION=
MTCRDMQQAPQPMRRAGKLTVGQSASAHPQHLPRWVLSCQWKPTQ